MFGLETLVKCAVEAGVITVGVCISWMFTKRLCQPTVEAAADTVRNAAAAAVAKATAVVTGAGPAVPPAATSTT